MGCVCLTTFDNLSCANEISDLSGSSLFGKGKFIPGPKKPFGQGVEQEQQSFEELQKPYQVQSQRLRLGQRKKKKQKNKNPPQNFIN